MTAGLSAKVGGNGLPELDSAGVGHRAHLGAAVRVARGLRGVQVEQHDEAGVVELLGEVLHGVGSYVESAVVATRPAFVEDQQSWFNGSRTTFAPDEAIASAVAA